MFMYTGLRCGGNLDLCLRASRFVQFDDDVDYLLFGNLLLA